MFINRCFKIFDYPDGMGFPIGGSAREFTYFYLQTHYNNPSATSGKMNLEFI